jgi:glycosyltransferase involved in cell wall biosynthesis
MRIFIVPIEPLDERYSEQWYRWWPEGLARLGHNVSVVDPPKIFDAGKKIKHGQFLDVYDTNIYKAGQAATLAQLFRDGVICDGDCVLFLDAWNPAVDQAAYMRDAGDRKVVLAGCWHAGTYDPHDFLTQKGMSPWAAYSEMAWGRALDLNFFATEFHARLFQDTRTPDPATVHVTGFPLLAQEWQQYSMPWSERPMIVVFPHRLAPEKGLEDFRQIVELYEKRYATEPETKTIRWVRTRDEYRPKQVYCELLGSARVAVSTARQETWGIAMLEAASLGCHICAPDRLSYPEIYEAKELYRSVDEAVEIIHAALHASEPRPWDGARWENAIGKAAALIQKKCEEIRAQRSV